MENVTLRAHFNGQYIELDEPFELQANTKLIVTVLPSQRSTEEDAELALLSRMGLEAAYGEDEPDYPLALIKEWNPEYEGR